MKTYTTYILTRLLYAHEKKISKSKAN